jgi:uncharacterized protein (TIGR02145 family)
MKIQLNRKGRVSLPLFTATLALALAFTFTACDSGGGGDGDGTGGGNYTDKGNSISSYSTKTIGTQVWMTENLNYKVAGSKCYGEDGQVFYIEGDEFITITLSDAEIQSNCNKYGRLYDWETAKTVCPSGWHLPSNDEWQTLVDFAGDESLKATNGWNTYEGKFGNGIDTFGFSALPGGSGVSGGVFDGSFSGIGNDGIWWSSSEFSSIYAYEWYMRYDYEGVFRNNIGSGKSNLYSVRCLKD